MFSGAVFVTMAYSFSFSQDGMRGFKVRFYPTYLNEAHQLKQVFCISVTEWIWYAGDHSHAALYRNGFYC